MIHGPDVIGHLLNVVQGHAGGFRVLEEQQVGERGLRALDLAGQHGLVADVHVEKERRLRQEQCHPVQPAQGQRGLLQQVPEVLIKFKRRGRRQRIGDERLDGFAHGGDNHVLSGRFSPHVVIEASLNKKSIIKGYRLIL